MAARGTHVPSEAPDEADEPDNGMIAEPEDEGFQIQNFVCTAELWNALNLNALAIGLGLKKTEYEPERFPGLIYRPPRADSVVLLFASGRVVYGRLRP